MSNERFREIERWTRTFDALPDGAFLGALEERGIDVDDLADFAEEQERRKQSRANRK